MLFLANWNCNPCLTGLIPVSYRRQYVCAQERPVHRRRTWGATLRSGSSDGANYTTAFAPLPLLSFCLIHFHFHFHTCRVCCRRPFPILIGCLFESSPPLEDLPGFALDADWDYFITSICVEQLLFGEKNFFLLYELLQFSEYCYSLLLRLV